MISDTNITAPILEVDDLRVHFKVGRGQYLRAVDGVSFRLNEGENVGLVGESGCGKTTIGNAIVRLAPISSGRILFNGHDIADFKGGELTRFRQQVQMVFQDPFGSLNPRMSVGASISEVLQVHKIVDSKQERHIRVAELLQTVELESEYASRYPHEFSGGQRQRIGIARALAMRPSLLIADEPVSALDVSVQAQILNLMKDLQNEMSLSYLFIAHDLAVVRYMCNRILVMYLGKIVESASTDELFERPAHPYTEALLSAVPDVDKSLRAGKGGTGRIVLKGDVPSPIDVIPGCPFHPRCHRARAVCSKEVPPAKIMGKDHTSVCHFVEEL